MARLPRYRTGDPDLDQRIADLITQIGDVRDTDLVFEMMVSAVRLARDRASRGDLKIANAALKEMRYAFAVFEPYRAARKAAIFGSARTTRDDPLYAQTVALARELAQADWMVITGAGPGIMEAGIEGAGAANSFGVSIRLPFEAVTTQFLADDPKLVNFRYFFTRKVTFVKEAHAFVLLPGGFGTLDEGFELLTLVQTGKAPPAPIVLLDVPGGTFWLTWMQFVERELRARGYISPEDVNIVKITDDASDALAEITGFYRNYHSLRFVDGDLVLRMQHLPPAPELDRLNTDFADMLASGRIEPAETSRAELADDDVPDLARLRMRFDRRSYSRLRELIDRLNAVA
ncbi:MAG TPA: TIGR00730 family Rossman fold protein [Acidimicrobiia bacterium]|nr:TIGR00730 family Rossman fold protein [Acidimicrobiia bacterium]